MKRRPTILDVAKAAGVSKSTVSLVLQNSALVRDETALSVREAMAKVGYVYNRAAANLRSASTGLIGLVMYYVGKIEAKAPDLDYLSEVNAILLSADYMAKQFPADAERCAGEAADKGRKLQEIGQALSGAGQAAAGHQH